jgi:hypothetical protein
LAAQVGQRGTVDPLGAHHVDVILLDQLFRREGFGRAEHHVAGIVDDDIETAGLGDDAGDTGLGGSVELHVQFGVRRSTLCSAAHSATVLTCGALRPCVSRIEA